MVGLLAGSVLLVSGLWTVPAPVVVAAATAALLATVVMGAEAWRVSRRTGRGAWASLRAAARAGAVFLSHLL